MKLDLHDLESALKRVDDRLFLLRNRGDGNPIFVIYANNGVPTTEQRAFIVRRGEGQCKQLDGLPLPTTGIVDWENGWGGSGASR